MPVSSTETNVASTAATTPPLLSTLIPRPPRTDSGPAQPPLLTLTQTVQAVEEQIVVWAAPTPSSHLSVPAEHWDWSHLRDYVVAGIETTLGHALPGRSDSKSRAKEKAIFTGFLARYGDRSPDIARYAFTVAEGYWRNAPISVQRFCRNSDQYFADPIIKHLDAVAAAKAARI